MRSTLLPLCALALLAHGPAAGAELYKWVDENGVVNYSNTPPPKTPAGKPPSVVEDTISVYTPEKTVTDEIERSRQRLKQPPPPLAGSAPPAVIPPPAPVADVRTGGTIGPPAAPAPPYDPCRNPNDPGCPGVIYDSSPVFQGRRSRVPLVQPQVPAGTIAGQGAGPGAYIPGQSGTARALPEPPGRSDTAPFKSFNELERERRREPERRRER